VLCIRFWFVFWLGHKNRKDQEVQKLDYDEKLK